MATMVERPMSVISDAPVLHHQRRPSSMEVIDVDSLDDRRPPGLRRHTPRPLERQQPITITLLDSDEEDSGPLHGARRRRLISPPPPASVGPSRVPPVPSVPRNLSAFTSLPRHRRAPVPSPPVVRPIDQPFSFEANLPAPASTSTGPSHVHPNRFRRIQQLHSEPRSQHVPLLALGGALVSFNRAQAETRLQQRLDREAQMRGYAAAAAAPEPGFLGRAGHALGRVFSFMSRSGLADESDDTHVQDLFGDDIAGRFDHPARHFAIREALLRSTERQMEYKPEYTHPGKPDPGYVFDFGPPESPSVEDKPTPIVIDLEADSETFITGSSTAVTEPASPKPSSLLVCANCLEPLVLGAELTGEEGRKKRVWGLRCGHLIDGKCLDALGSPQAGNGDEKVAGEAVPVLRTDHKGKGKARAAEHVPMAIVEDNSIRSRLRSRGSVPSVSSVTAPSPQPPPAPAVLGKRKRGAKPRIEGTYEWKCPVSTCGHMHASVKMDGVWLPEPDQKPSNGKAKGKARWDFVATITGRGPIAVFV